MLPASVNSSSESLEVSDIIGGNESSDSLNSADREVSLSDNVIKRGRESSEVSLLSPAECNGGMISLSLSESLVMDTKRGKLSAHESSAELTAEVGSSDSVVASPHAS